MPISKPAFEICKGPRSVTTLSENDVEKHLDPNDLISALEDGFRGLELGEVQAPPRTKLTLPNGVSLAMPAWRPGMQIAVKLINFSSTNLERGLPNHLAFINLFDPETGLATCLMDGTYITAIRTAAAATLSVRMLSRADSRVATIIGAGVQGFQHLRLLPLARDFERINILSLRFADAERLAAHSKMARATGDIEAAVRESDIVCLTTHSPSPVINSEWVKPGTHVSSVGYCPPDGELPRDLVTNHRIFVETLDAFQAPPVGCGELAGLDRSRGTTLGAVLLGRKPGRISDDEITIYKAMGLAMEDMVAANLAYQTAKRNSAGGVMEW